MISKVGAISIMSSMVSLAARGPDLQRALRWFKTLRFPRGRIGGKPISTVLNLHKQNKSRTDGQHAEANSQTKVVFPGLIDIERGLVPTRKDPAILW